MPTETVLIPFDTIFYETDLATRFDIDGRQIWIPKSVIEDVYDDNTVEVARWFAEKEELI